MRWRNLLLPISLIVSGTFSAESDYNIVQTDGSFDFRYDNPDSFHESHGNRNNVVKGVFGGRNPGTGAIDSIEYTAGPRGFRPRGKNVARKYDFGQTPTGPIGNKDDPYYDPYEDPSYNFQFNTRSYVRKEGANRLGDVKGSYSFIDDVGDRHDVEYIAGKNTGFHVKSPHPDSNPNAFRTTYFHDPRRRYLRGRSFVQRGLDGSYRFAAVGPDQRRTETSDAVGNVRGSYTYRDEKGVQHSVHYIAGPNIGYRVLKNVKGPHLPTFYPFNSPSIVPSDFYDQKEADLDVFTEAASSYVTPTPNKDNDYYPDNTNQIDVNQSTRKPSGGGSQSTISPIGGGLGSRDEDEEEFDDFFGNGKPGGGKGKPSTTRPSVGRPSAGRPRPGFVGTSTARPGIGLGTTRPGYGVGASRPSPSASTTSRPGFGGSTTTARPTTGRPGLDTAESGRPTLGGFPFDGSTTARPSLDGTSVRPGFGGSTARPSFSTGRPDLGTTIDLSETGIPDGVTRPTYPSGTSRPLPTTTGRPTTFAPGFSRPLTIGGRPQQRPTTSRPKPRPTIDFGLGVDDDDDEDIFGSPNKPRPSPTVSRPSTTSSVSGFSTGRPQPTTPTFTRPPTSFTQTGIVSSTIPTSPEEEKPVLLFNLTEIEKGKFHTLVTNLGDTLFTVPPGVSVRAHVQNIDLIPFYARSPSPSEQYNAEMDDEEEQISAETSNTPITVLKNIVKRSTTPLPPSSTKPTGKRSISIRTDKSDERDDDDDDVDIF